MLYKIIVRDLSRFIIIYCIIVIGFSQCKFFSFFEKQQNFSFLHFVSRLSSKSAAFE